jgi:hypothetical protein
MRVKMILPALTETQSPFWRPIKYSLFPPVLAEKHIRSILQENVHGFRTDGQVGLIRQGSG